MKTITIHIGDLPEHRFAGALFPETATLWSAAIVAASLTAQPKGGHRGVIIPSRRTVRAEAAPDTAVAS